MGLTGIVGIPLGWVMWLCYQITNNYGIALFLFTLITRLIMVPFTIKQQKSTAKMSMLRPQMEQLQAKYANNKEKLNEETMKLYQQEGYNPMSGCLPLLIQMPILFGLIDVIYKPLKHILRLSAEVIDQVTEIATQLGLSQNARSANSIQITAVQAIQENSSQWAAIGQDVITQIKTLDLNFFGINLGNTPAIPNFSEIFTTGLDPLILVPILSGVSALLMSLMTMKNTAATAGDAAGGASMKGMMLMMPIFSVVIAFQVPAGVGIYWFYSNLIGMVQTFIMHKVYNPQEIAEKAKQEFEERQERERLERIEAKKNAKKNAQELGEKAMTQKELNRKKLAEARKRDAEKYGEEYVEVTDEDLK